MAAAFNFIGAFAGTAVAKTIGSGLVQEATTTQTVVIAALLGAIAWNLVTWLLGLPSSSSHALIGGLLGATLVAAGAGAYKVDGIVGKVLVPMIVSPRPRVHRGLRADAVDLLDLPARASPAARPGVPADPGPVGRVHGLLPRLERRAEDDGHHHPGPVHGRRHPGRDACRSG